MHNPNPLKDKNFEKILKSCIATSCMVEEINFMIPSQSIEESFCLGVDAFGLGPKAFKIIKFPLLMVENMDDNIVEVEENP